MAIWNNRPHTATVLKAAQQWKRECFTGDGSLFSAQSLWTAQKLAELRQAFVGNPIAGNESFVDKLRRQLQAVEVDIQQLAAEAIWLLYLFVADAQMAAETKRKRIAQIWPASTGKLDSPLLSDESLSGIARPGTAFMTKMPDELAYLLSIILAFKQLPPEQRNTAMSDPWRLGEWVDQQPDSTRRAFRHVLLYFCFPESFERISSARHKRTIRDAFEARLSPEQRTDDWGLLATDRVLLLIRRMLGEQYGTSELDFYVPPLREQWWKSKGREGEEAVARRLPVSLSSAGSYTVDDALEDLFLERQEAEDILMLWEAKKNIILQGPPGVGKSFAAAKLAFALMGTEDRDRLGFVQFHQSYSYEDFVEGFRPVESGFALQPGIFFEFCQRAAADAEREYVFIIDEINRGNLSRILGELMLLIEGDKRTADWALSLAGSRSKFHVPENVNVIGLMNTADRSLAVVDYALRRRFGFVDLKPKLGSPKFKAHVQRAGLETSLVERLVGRIEALNDEIESSKDLGSGFAIGHSFFCDGPRDGEGGASWYDRVIRTEILPLLREYWSDAPEKVKNWERNLLAIL